MAGHEEQKPWSREEIGCQLELLRQDSACVAALCERMARIEAYLAGGAGLRNEQDREGAMKSAAKLHEICKLSLTLMERIRRILKAEQRRLDS
jgi:hypothetical protein